MGLLFRVAVRAESSGKSSTEYSSMCAVLAMFVGGLRFFRVDEMREKVWD